MYNVSNELAKLNQLLLSVWVSEPLKGKVSKMELAQMELQEPKEDGFIAATREKVSFAIRINSLISMPDIKVVMVGPPKNGSPIDLLGNYGMDDSPVYLKVVPTHEIVDGYTTKPVDNNFRIISTRDNIFRMFQVGVATRIDSSGESYYFLTVQEMYKSELVLANGRITAPDFPGYEDWDDLKDLISEMVDPMSLSLSKTPTESKMKDPSTFSGNEGQVIYFNLIDGNGRAQTRDGVQFFHWTQIDIDDRLAYLEAGQDILFSAVQSGAKGTQLIGVRPRS